ncbi:glycosyltransferase [Terrihabitans sp. B22-R8]|uniref:glycosyltransferase n=1 Tax=Terrihabitans sp. B22-R8 TaxID=3425128 RepID=UPI00403C4ED2
MTLEDAKTRPGKPGKAARRVRREAATIVAPPALPEIAAPVDELRVLMLSHMDPRLSKGGAEIAAFQLYQELTRRPEVTGWFISSAPGKIERRDGVKFSQPFGPNDYIYIGNGFDHFIHSNPDPEMRSELIKLVSKIQPHVIHFHHYTNFGMEMLLAMQAAAPDAKIIMTLHEFLAICNHFGQMVKRPSFNLCQKSGPRACHTCFPERTPQDFFLREMFIKRFFRIVDHFISPSHFLADRYADWGLDRSQIAVIENGNPAIARREEVAYPTLENGLTVGFFGQISKLKGINVVLEAAEILHESEVPVRIEVFGDYSSQPEDFQKDFRERLEKAPPNFLFRGPYDNSRVNSLMQSVHAVLVPSIWWENSPLVIQESLANRRAVICSDIGGMAEKVRDGLDGFHFQVGSGWSLANLLKDLAEHPERLANVQQTIAMPPSIAETTGEVYALYRDVMTRTKPFTGGGDDEHTWRN